MKYGFLDEAGDVGYADRSSTHLLTVVVVVGQPDPLRKAVARTRADSATERALQVADAVAWSLLQKYEHQDERLWQVVKGRIAEIVLW